MPRVFISCVTAEFGAYRVKVAKYLRRSPDCEVRVQEDFNQVPEDTIQKLDAYIRSCDAVIHVVGEGAGAVANQKAVSSFLKSEPEFAARMKEVGDFETIQISYTQWEAMLAAYHGKPLFVYRASLHIDDGYPTKGSGFDRDWPPFEEKEGDAGLVSQHCLRLERLPTPRYSSPFKSLEDFIGQLIADLYKILGPKAHAQTVLHERFGAHKVDELRHTLRTMAAPLLNEAFVLAAFIQISDSIPSDLGHDRALDLALVDVLAERRAPHELLGFVKACELRSAELGLGDLSRALASWFSAALDVFNSSREAKSTSSSRLPNEDLTEAAVMGRCGEAFHFLQPHSFPKPSLEVAWRSYGSAPQRLVIAEGYVRWGRCRQRASIGDPIPIPVVEALTRLVGQVQNSKHFRYVAFNRLDVFVSREELDRPWEYASGGRPDDEEAQLLPWPSVVRLLGREMVFGTIKPPPDPITRHRLACQLGRCDTFMADLRERGAFFAASGEPLDGAVTFGRAASRASLGFWIRNAKPVEVAEACLDALEGLAFATVPRVVFEKKLDSPQGSAWRDMAVLYDHPDWPAFKFSEDQHQLADHEQMLHAMS